MLRTLTALFALSFAPQALACGMYIPPSEQVNLVEAIEVIDGANEAQDAAATAPQAPQRPAADAKAQNKAADAPEPKA